MKPTVELIGKTVAIASGGHFDGQEGETISFDGQQCKVVTADGRKLWFAPEYLIVKT